MDEDRITSSSRLDSVVPCISSKGLVRPSSLRVDTSSAKTLGTPRFLSFPPPCFTKKGHSPIHLSVQFRLSQRLYFCPFFLLLMACSVSTLMAQEPESAEDTVWMGQVIMSQGSSSIDSSGHGSDDNTEPKRTFSRNYRLTESVTLTVCGTLYDLEVTDVTGAISEFMEEQYLEEYSQRVCCRVESECRKHGPLYRSKHFDELYITKEPGNSEFRRHSIKGGLHTSSRCGPYGRKGVKEPKVELLPVFDLSANPQDEQYRLYATAVVLEDSQDIQTSESRDVCTGQKKTEEFRITTSDCGTEPTGTRSDTEDATFQSSIMPPPEYLLSGWKEGKMNDHLLSDSKTDFQAAKYPGDYSSYFSMFWYLSTTPSSAYDACRKTAADILKSCIDGAYHIYDERMDRQKVEAEGARCAEGYLVKCFEDAGSIADPKERGNRMSRCVEEHCNTELFPDDLPESSLSEESLNGEIGKCTEDYLDRVGECSRDYGCK